ncbi:hypothetical protein ACFZBM_23020 [Streptomyces lavendulae]|uniref:Uncharacterized protein n=1 Tax=Streptomyces lavendulae subsp. lavendulae TaxID=58340 RepID=A0A2K8PJJ1_STRLA|nr:hypothetical protein [Streptomyces lavendulae]ATZ26638.1 hypothetical protein SLAV_24180 [Streptomyces lavendulae subsp. lavendulae]QUQ56466.1 hypothetical protein SLLC_22310 [Streptomyces lavendulae subsp. lavendulae]
MESTYIGLAVAVVGVAGTLMASVLSPRLLARIQSEQFTREQRAAEAQWLREQQVAGLARRREAYANVNASFRRYRTHLLNFLWTVHKGAVTEAAREVIEEARRDHHSVFAAAQIVASARVLAELNTMTRTLSETYRRIMCLEEGDPDPDGSFEELKGDFTRLWDQWEEMLGAMRADLGVEESGSGRADAASSAS